VFSFRDSYRALALQKGLLKVGKVASILISVPGARLQDVWRYDFVRSRSACASFGFCRLLLVAARNVSLGAATTADDSLLGYLRKKSSVRLKMCLHIRLIGLTSDLLMPVPRNRCYIPRTTSRNRVNFSSISPLPSPTSQEW